jgi:glycine cleavage system aminomethyltransferase T
MALGYVPPACAADGTKLDVEINGAPCPSRVVVTSQYDSTGQKMRS